MPQPECMVQCSGVSLKEGWRPALLYRFLPSQCLHEERLLPTARDSGSPGEFGRCWSFFMLRPKSGFWQIKMDESSKQYTAFTVGNLGFFECNCMPLGLYNAHAMFQQLMQNYLGELNLIYCLINLDDTVVFLKMAEEDLHQRVCTHCTATQGVKQVGNKSGCCFLKMP